MPWNNFQIEEIFFFKVTDLVVRMNQNEETGKDLSEEEEIEEEPTLGWGGGGGEEPEEMLAVTLTPRHKCSLHCYYLEDVGLLASELCQLEAVLPLRLPGHHAPVQHQGVPQHGIAPALLL